MTTTQTEQSMAALADILRQNGICVTQVLDIPEAPRRVIAYDGDKDDGFRAVNIALEQGFPLVRLECNWQIKSRRLPEWRLFLSSEV